MGKYNNKVSKHWLIFFKIFYKICVFSSLHDHFVWGLSFPTSHYIFESKYNSSTFYQNVMGRLRLQLYAMIWDITYSKISNIISRISEFIGHESTPPSRIEIWLSCLTPTHLCACLKLISKFSSAFGSVFLCPMIRSQRYLIFAEMLAITITGIVSLICFYIIMKCIFKEWWFTIQTVSVKRTITSHKKNVSICR